MSNQTPLGDALHKFIEPGETLREFLERRERELGEEITALHGQLMPKEAELAEVRRAKGALGIPSIFQLSARGTAHSSGRGTLHADAAVMPAVTVAPSDVTVVSPPPPLTQTRVPNSASWQNNSDQAAAEITIERNRRNVAAVLAGMPPSPYENFTMKQLVVKALAEHFQNGATAKQLREFFRDAWGREIERANLSPQLSRLKWEKVIDLEEETGIWKLVPAKIIPREEFIAQQKALAEADAQASQTGKEEKPAKGPFWRPKDDFLD